MFDTKTLEENGPTRIRINKSARARQARRKDVWAFDSMLYDKVLVDAECTHDGSIRHLQKLKTLEAWTNYMEKYLNATQLERIRDLQHHLIRNGFRLLKVGGIMIYSTCSLSIRQNEDIVRDFLSETPNAKLFAMHPHDSLPCDPGSLEGTLRFSPRRNTSGLFIARIQKVEDN
uniref:Uncharacterized protein AlNc14C1692G13037 n=1 Tax=Albugo laibachii Nc14 TaxID=890382 RepID=F0X2T3_9STRA|nr:conserved hypothetical protein [Albugo laibachii Nc14]|eukprot:CCA28236.1 conserved hypothetical protein [Albugo laibachii Nc14]